MAATSGRLIAVGVARSSKLSRDAHSQARRLFETGKSGSVGSAGILESLAGRRCLESADFGALACGPESADHGPGSRQSRLAVVLRRGLGVDERRLRHAIRVA